MNQPKHTSQKKIFTAEMVGLSLLTSRLGLPFLSMLISPLVLYFSGWKGFIQFNLYSFAIYALLNPLQIILIFTTTGATTSALTSSFTNLQQTVTTSYTNPALVQQSLNQLIVAMQALLIFDLLALAGFIGSFTFIYYYMKHKLSKQLIMAHIRQEQIACQS